MHLFLLYVLTIPLIADTSSNNLHWEKTKHWKIYALNNTNEVFAIPADSMKSLKSIPMNDDSVHLLIETVKFYPVPMSPAWMGCYLTSCDNEKGQFMKIVVSVYGGFFLNESDGRYYNIDQGTTPLWLNYMRRSYIKTE